MRFFAWSLAALALAGHSVVLAEGCPTRADGRLVSSFGPEVARIDDAMRMFQPRGLTMLGQPVTFVLVKTTESWDDTGRKVTLIDEVSYRLGTVRRESGHSYPNVLTWPFQQAYPGSQCPLPEGQGLSCHEYMDNFDPGKLVEVGLDYPDIFLDDASSGAGLALLRRDEDVNSQDDSVPAYLVCHFET